MLRSLLFFSLMPLAYSAAPQYTLPDGVQPLRHRMEITVDPSQERFTGTARIDVRIDRPQTEIWIHGRDLKISSAALVNGGKTSPLRVEYSANEFIGLIPPGPVNGRELTLVLQYEALLSSTDSSGPYRTQNGTDWYAFTTFTPTDARRAFPCFDEPRFKTPWEMAIRVRGDHKAFANAPEIAATVEPNGWHLHQFAATRPLASEVIAFAVGPFDVWNGAPSGVKAIPVRVVTARGEGKRGEQAAKETVEILPRLERYTGIPYPWEKLDHVALPRSAFGAVENPGLITYNGASLLEAESVRIRALQAHELAHQWFGNLVTQASWIDVWLSEGFATWFSARTMDEEQPAGRKRVASSIARERIMQRDDSPEARPVRLERSTREEFKTVYDQTVYQKGAAILVMLEQWLGPEKMQRGLRDYLASHALGNASTADLQTALQVPEGVLNGYLNTTGVPRISMKVDCGGTSKVTITRDSGKTPVPVCLRTESARSCVVVKEQPVDIPVASCPAFVYPNDKGSGYYRVHWTAAQLRELGKSVHQLDGAERITLAYDLRALKSTETEIGTVLQQLAKDPEPEIAHAAKVALGIEQDDPPRRRR